MSAKPGSTGLGRRLSALGSASAYAAGIPALLWRSAHWPLPHRVPTLHDISVAFTPGRRPGTEVVVKAFAVVAWSLWAHIGAAVIAEMRAQRQGRSAALGSVPAWARPLVVRLAAMFLALVPALGVRPAGAAPVPLTAMTVTAPVCQVTHGNPVVEGSSARTADPPVAASAAPVATREYHVRPGDNLWDIAATHLGEPRRYQEIFELNRSRIQPDGRRLTRSGLIRPGWVLELPIAPPPPAEVSPPSVPPSTPEPVSPLPVPASTPEPVGAVPSTTLPRSRPPSGLEQHAGDGPAAVTNGRQDADPATTRPAADDHPVRRAHEVGLPLLVASSVIGGLGLLRRNRRNARRRHHRFPPPPSPLVDVERDVRAIARSEAPRWVAGAVRHLAGALTEDGAPPPPDVLAVRAGDLGVEVLIGRPWPLAPGRFLPVDDGHTWRLDAAVDLDELEALARPIPSYLTALATVGESDAGAVLIDLDHAGTLLVDGQQDQAEALLGSIALELATAPWADLVDLCLVGAPEAFAGLERLERVRLLDPDTAVIALKRCAGTPGVSGLTAASLGDIPPGPTVAVVWPGALSDDDLASLAAMAEPHTGLVLVAVDAPLACPWRLTIGGDGAGVLSPLGLALTVPTGADTIGALALLLADAAAEDTDVLVDQPGDDTAAEPGDPRPDAPQAGDQPTVTDSSSVRDGAVTGHPDDTAAETAEPALPTPELSGQSLDGEAAPVAEVRILGPVEITWRGPAPQRPQPGELVAYLATHRYPVSGDHVRLALWPARADDDRFGERNKSTLWALTSRTRQALGKDDVGKDLLPKEAGNFLSLSPAVVCDWDCFRQLVDHARRHPDTAVDTLVRALQLVRGRLFQDVRSGYAWVELEHLDAEIDAAITDAALDLVDLALAAADLASARHAIRHGLLASPGSEPLLRTAMRVAHAAGDQPGVERAWRDIERVTGELGFDPHPESIELYRTLRRQGASA